MKMSVMFPSKYLKADDIISAGGEMTVTITGVVLGAFDKTDGSQETKPIVSFAGQDKQLILNKTNARRIESILGFDDSEDWIGKSITLITEKVDAFGKIQDAVRVKLNSTVFNQKAHTNLGATSDFWGKIYGELKMAKEEGDKILTENGGDFEKALAAITGNTEQAQAEADML